MKLTLRRAFRFSSPATVAMIGAGGKTSTLYQLGREYQPQHPLVLLTTTTHLGQGQPEAADRHLVYEGNLAETFEQIRSGQGVMCLTASWDSQTRRWNGLELESLHSIAQFTQEEGIPLLIEADGARGRCLKAPANHEPLIPSFCDQVILVAGLTALGKPLSDTWVHRPERFAELSGLSLGEIIHPEAVARVLKHPLGGRKGIPANATKHVLLTQAETPEIQAAAKRLSVALLSHFERVVIAAKGNPFSIPAGDIAETACSTPAVHQPYQLLAVHEPIAGIILAAGASTRLGQAKPLLVWRGETLVHRAARIALEADLRPVLVVCGAEGEQVSAAVSDLPVQVVYNERWQSGQSTSIKAALNALGNQGGGAIFLLVDQPFISVALLQSLVENHAQSLAAVIAPRVADRRTNPVLFDRETFAELLLLEGDVGGRAIFSRFPPQWLDWYDERLPFDLDTPADYQKLMEIDDEWK